MADLDKQEQLNCSKTKKGEVIHSKVLEPKNLKEVNPYTNVEKKKSLIGLMKQRKKKGKTKLYMIYNEPKLGIYTSWP